MKKALVVLLSLVAAGALFAADAPTFALSGAVKTGVLFQTGDTNEDGSWKLYNDDAGKTSRLEIVGTYADADYGLKFRLRSDDFAAAPSVSYAYVWGDFLADMITFKAGAVDDGAWATKGDTGFDVADGKGVQVQFKPIAGLNFGLKLDLVAANATTEQFIGETAVGLGYTAEKFNFQAGYKMDSDVDGSSEDEAFAYAGIQFVGIEALTVTAEAKLTNLGDTAVAAAVTTIDEVVEYSGIESLTLGLISYQVLSGDDNVDMKISVNPYANYKLNDKATAKFGVYYEMQGDASDIWVQPGVEYVLGAKAKVNAFLNYDMKDTGSVATNDTKIQIDFLYSF